MPRHGAVRDDGRYIRYGGPWRSGMVAAVNDAIRKAQAAGQAEMAKITEGLPLPPGMKLPFG